MTHKISIDDLENSVNKTISYHFEDKIDGINSNGQICADLELKSLTKRFLTQKDEI